MAHAWARFRFAHPTLDELAEAGDRGDDLIDRGSAGLPACVSDESLGRALDLAHAESGCGEIVEDAHHPRQHRCRDWRRPPRARRERIDEERHLVGAPSRRRNPRISAAARRATEASAPVAATIFATSYPSLWPQSERLATMLADHVDWQVANEGQEARRAAGPTGK